jgi:hypothetical protein
VTATGAEAFPGSYETHVDIFSLGFTYRSDVGMAPSNGAQVAPTKSLFETPDSPQ